MRLWSIHPMYLDCKGLTAVWREALLAKKVLQGKTRKYSNHPQLDRFRGKPLSFINGYLLGIWKEAEKRCYRFDKRKVGRGFTPKRMEVTRGQLEYEFRHLKNKLKTRDPAKYRKLLGVKRVEAHPIFVVKKGPVESWEKIKPAGRKK
jgi:hypothetical protein